jgi:hypothetical protein
MPRRGRPLAATPDQVEQVQALASQGASKRKIAEIVFGDARFHGRVERIGRRQASSPRPDDVSEDGTVLAGEPELPPIRELLNRYRQRLANASDLPSLKEIALLLKLEHQVETDEMLEQLNALTREPADASAQ